ncbi:YeiH family protein [Actimicrobium antarcticum]|uniref:YeiH family protein n=2 Tax=Actimicrobium antarcticum TaxID=1051899 RepID=A0ABP7T0G9_9BURK
MRFPVWFLVDTVQGIGISGMPEAENLMASMTTLARPVLQRSWPRQVVARVTVLAPGLLLSAGIAVAALLLGRVAFFAGHGLGTLTLAIGLGIVLGNTGTVRRAASYEAGVHFSKQKLLRLGIILYGFRLTMQQIGEVGVAGVMIDALVLGSTFGLALLLGLKVFRLDRETVILIGAGSSICGAAAILATAPVLRARAESVTVAVSTVVVFGTLAIFVYPLLFRLNAHWQVLGLAPATFGVYVGSTLHEVAQVVAAARSVSEEAANTAVIAKMVRVMMLAPFLIGLSVTLSRRGGASDTRVASAGRLELPWFAVIFIAMVGLNSLSLLPAVVVEGLIALDTVLLAMAMAALGLGTQVAAIRRAGARPLLLAGLLFGWLIAGGALINRLVMQWIG